MNRNYNYVGQHQAPNTPTTNDKFYKCVDEVVNYLYHGSHYHELAGNIIRDAGFRGWGRWNYVEAECDYKSMLELDKLLSDHLSYIPTIYPNKEDKVINVKSVSDLKDFHIAWCERERKLIEELNTAINESRSLSIEIYEFLCCLQKEVQNEEMRVRFVIKRLDITGWNPHDVMICSMLLHEYFENKYDGKTIDFNLG